MCIPHLPWKHQAIFPSSLILKIPLKSMDRRERGKTPLSWSPLQIFNPILFFFMLMYKSKLFCPYAMLFVCDFISSSDFQCGSFGNNGIISLNFKPPLAPLCEENPSPTFFYICMLCIYNIHSYPPICSLPFWEAMLHVLCTRTAKLCINAIFICRDDDVTSNPICSFLSVANCVFILTTIYNYMFLRLILYIRYLNLFKMLQRNLGKIETPIFS